MSTTTPTSTSSGKQRRLKKERHPSSPPTSHGSRPQSPRSPLSPKLQAKSQVVQAVDEDEDTKSLKVNIGTSSFKEHLQPPLLEQENKSDHCETDHGQNVERNECSTVSSMISLHELSSSSKPSQLKRASPKKHLLSTPSSILAQRGRLLRGDSLAPPQVNQNVDSEEVHASIETNVITLTFTTTSNSAGEDAANMKNKVKNLYIDTKGTDVPLIDTQKEAPAAVENGELVVVCSDSSSGSESENPSVTANKSDPPMKPESLAAIGNFIDAVAARQKQLTQKQKETAHGEQNSYVESQASQESSLGMNVDFPDQVTLNQMSKFVDELQSTDQQLASQLDEALKFMSLSNDDYDASFKLKPETLRALGQYIDAVSGNRPQQNTGTADQISPVTMHTMNSASGETFENFTFVSNDLDTEALSVLGHYIDAITGPHAESPIKKQSAVSEESESNHSSEATSSLPPAAAAAAAARAAEAKRKRMIKCDPPSVGSSTSEGEREDPPITLTPSEEAGRRDLVVERNPNKDSPASTQHRDPDESTISQQGESESKSPIVREANPDPPVGEGSSDEVELVEEDVISNTFVQDGVVYFSCGKPEYAQDAATEAEEPKLKSSPKRPAPEVGAQERKKEPKKKNSAKRPSPEIDVNEGQEEVKKLNSAKRHIPEVSPKRKNTRTHGEEGDEALEDNNNVPNKQNVLEIDADEGHEGAKQQNSAKRPIPKVSPRKKNTVTPFEDMEQEDKNIPKDPLGTYSTQEKEVVEEFKDCCDESNHKDDTPGVADEVQEHSDNETQTPSGNENNQATDFKQEANAKDACYDGVKDLLTPIQDPASVDDQEIKGKIPGLTVETLEKAQTSELEDMQAAQTPRRAHITKQDVKNEECEGTPKETQARKQPAGPSPTLKRLWSILSKLSDGKQTMDSKSRKHNTLESFAELFQLAFPYFDGKQPTAVDCARLQIQSRRKHIPVAMTSNLLEQLRSLEKQEVSLDLLPLHPSVQSLRLSKDPMLRQEALLLRLVEVKDAERRRNVLIYSTIASGDEEDEAVEIDLSGSFKFAAKEYPDSDISDSVKWWEAAAKLTKIVEDSRKADDIEIPTMDDPSSDSESCEEGSSEEGSGMVGSGSSRQSKGVVDDIKEFWKGKDQKPPRQYGRRQQRKILALSIASFSMTDNDQSIQSIADRGSLSYGYGSSASSISEFEEDMWIRRRDMAIWPSINGSSWLSGMTPNVREPKRIDAVATTASFETPSFLRRRRCPGTNQWKQPYGPRTRTHPGYFNVDVRSLYISMQDRGHPHPLDSHPWERRSVKQRFLHEQSISYNRNWFGTTKKVYGNSKLRLPVCTPKSMEMPMKAEEWTKEWYTKPWSTPSPGASISASSTEKSTDDPMGEIQKIRRHYKIGAEFDDDNGSWEDTPECGTFRNVKLKPGERISRVTPDLTSSLWRSRWRKKHFPKGTFPY